MNTTKQIKEATKRLGIWKDKREKSDFGDAVRTALKSFKFLRWIMQQPDFELLNSYFLKDKLKEIMEE